MYIRRLRRAKEILHNLSAAGANVDHITQNKFLKNCNSLDIPL